MPRTKEQFEEMRQQTLDKIHSAGAKIFARDGLAGANVKSISDEAGISAGLLYRHYASKEALFDTLTQMAADGMQDLDQLFNANLSPDTVINLLTEQMITELTNNQEFINTMVFLTKAFMTGQQSDATKKLLTANTNAVNALTRIVETGQAQNIFRSGNAQELAITFFATIQGLAIMRFTSPKEFPMPSQSTLLDLFY